MTEFKFLNKKSIESADVRAARSGFRYGFIANLIQEEPYQQLVREFPDVQKFKLVDKQSGGGRKRFYVGPVYNAGKDQGCICVVRTLSPAWRAFMKECASQEATDLFRKHIGVQLNALCHFGLTFGNEGCIQEAHVDGAVREYDDSPIPSTWATIVYFNERPGDPGGTRVYDTDRTTVLFEAPSMRNGLFFFEQHADAWHGFPLMLAGSERRVLSLAYSNEKKLMELKEGLIHRIQCKTYWRGLAKHYKGFIKK